MSKTKTFEEKTYDEMTEDEHFLFRFNKEKKRKKDEEQKKINDIDKFHKIFSNGDEGEKREIMEETEDIESCIYDSEIHTQRVLFETTNTKTNQKYYTIQTSSLQYKNYRILGRRKKQLKPLDMKTIDIIEECVKPKITTENGVKIFTFNFAYHTKMKKYNFDIEKTKNGTIKIKSFSRQQHAFKGVHKVRQRLREKMILNTINRDKKTICDLIEQIKGNKKLKEELKNRFLYNFRCNTSVICDDRQDTEKEDREDKEYEEKREKEREEREEKEREEKKAIKKMDKKIRLEIKADKINKKMSDVVEAQIKKENEEMEENEIIKNEDDEDDEKAEEITTEQMDKEDGNTPKGDNDEVIELIDIAEEFGLNEIGDIVKVEELPAIKEIKKIIKRTEKTTKNLDQENGGNFHQINEEPKKSEESQKSEESEESDESEEFEEVNELYGGYEMKGEPTKTAIKEYFQYQYKQSLMSLKENFGLENTEYVKQIWLKMFGKKWEKEQDKTIILSDSEDEQSPEHQKIEIVKVEEPKEEEREQPKEEEPQEEEQPKEEEREQPKEEESNEIDYDYNSEDDPDYEPDSEHDEPDEPDPDEEFKDYKYSSDYLSLLQANKYEEKSFLRSFKGSKSASKLSKSLPNNHILYNIKKDKKINKNICNCCNDNKNLKIVINKNDFSIYFVCGKKECKKPIYEPSKFIEKNDKMYTSFIKNFYIDLHKKKKITMS
jgi:hypothetical protein